jgi:hypothetical protein
LILEWRLIATGKEWHLTIEEAIAEFTNLHNSLDGGDGISRLESEATTFYSSAVQDSSKSKCRLSESLHILFLLEMLRFNSD